MNYAEINECSVADGDGCRVVLYCSGCNLNCKGCHNPQTWDFNYGKEFTEDTMRELIKALSKPYIKGLTLSGGHPLDEKNLPVVNKIVEEVALLFPEKTIWVYSGYTWEEILKQDEFYEERKINAISALDVLKNCDVLVDGTFIEEQVNLTLAYRGSDNQRIIDIKRSLEKGQVELWQI